MREISCQAWRGAIADHSFRVVRSGFTAPESRHSDVWPHNRKALTDTPLVNHHHLEDNSRPPGSSSRPARREVTIEKEDTCLVLHS